MILLSSFSLISFRKMLYSERVEEILNYVQDHPINVKSQKMRYVPTSQLDSARLPGFLNFTILTLINMLLKRTPPYFDQIVQIIRRTSLTVWNFFREIISFVTFVVQCGIKYSNILRILRKNNIFP